jgi:electron transfer flavoprotein alpha subunit
MSNVLVVGELKGSELKKISRELTSAARKIADAGGGKVTALLIGDKPEAHADALKAVGADTILTVSQSEYNTDAYVNIISQAIDSKKPSVVLMPHTSQGKDYSPRVAIRAKAGIVADVVALSIDGGKVVGKKPIYSGKAYANLKVSSAIQMFTVRPNSQELSTKAGDGATEALSASAGDIKVKTVSQDLSGGNKVQLTEASIIVSGGRGIKGPENWPMLQSLADTLGAALGASRATVDAGWISHSHQVGQTGKTVSPNCYIACGISGAIQHLAGMGSSKYIVAINKDKEAPIFKVATYGVVADLFEVVPALDSEFKKVLG